MNYTIAQIAKLVNGEIQGDANAIITKPTKIEEGELGSLSFYANPKYENYVYDTKATAIIVNKNFVPQKEISSILIKVDDPYSAFAKFLQTYVKEKKKNLKTPLFAKKVAKSAKIGKNVYLGNFVSVGENVTIGDGSAVYPNVTILENVKIGENVTIFPNAVIMNDCVIGNNCIINPGAVIGADGFGFAPLENGEYAKIPQTGNVVLEDNVEVGANTCIDRATMGSTIIHKGVKLDNLIQVGHNVEIGANTVIAGQTGVSGSAKVGEHCVIGGQVGVAGHITVAANTTIGAQSGVSGPIKKEGLTLLGAPAIDVKNFKTSFIYYKNLDKIVKRIDDLEKALKAAKGE